MTPLPEPLPAGRQALPWGEGRKEDSPVANSPLFHYSIRMRVLSGFQPSGKFHLGNYFGSIRPNIEFQKKSDVSFFMVADLHSLTSLKDPEELRSSMRDNVLDFLACGLDTEHSVLFRQSDISEHAELTWILSTVTPMGLLERAVSYKEKVTKGIAASVGLFTYPILMTADILLYRTDLVPVGKDQKQHVEIARDIALKFNNAYGETFVLPEPQIQKEVAVVPGTDGQKMSKSYGNVIPLFAPRDELARAVMSIVTDSSGDRPQNVYAIHKLVRSEQELEKMYDEHRGNYKMLKELLIEDLDRYLAPMRAKYEELKSDPGIVEEVLESGKHEARAISEAKMEAVRKAVGVTSQY